MPTSLLSTVLGQPIALASLHRALAAGRVHPVYLFEGPEGVGKERTAMGLAQTLLCEQRGTNSFQTNACSACSACKRLAMQSGDRLSRHPDLVVLERGLYEPSAIGRRTPETQELSIDQVRTLFLARVPFPPHEGRARVILVRRAEELSQAAANALLKTLEEPPPSSYVILLSEAPNALPSTLRSRTQRLRFGPLPEPVVVELLVQGGVEHAQALVLAPLALGSMARAKFLADPKAMDAQRRFLDRAFSILKESSLKGVLDLAEEAKKDKEGLDRNLHALAQAFAAQGRALVSSKDRQAEQAFARSQLVLETLQHLDENANPQLALESMLLQMRQS